MQGLKLTWDKKSLFLQLSPFHKPGGQFFFSVVYNYFKCLFLTYSISLKESPPENTNFIAVCCVIFEFSEDVQIEFIVRMQLSLCV